jgi:transcriptional regulator GlxA family with amidase domain
VQPQWRTAASAFVRTNGRRHPRIVWPNRSDKQLLRHGAKQRADHASITEDILLNAVSLMATIDTVKRAGARAGQYTRLSTTQTVRVRKYIEANIGADITLHDLAAVAKLSAFHFGRAFKQATGLSPYKFLLNARVERAKDLIRVGELSLTQIASLTGFKRLSQFSRTFSAIAGETARAFRQRCGGAAPDQAEE